MSQKVLVMGASLNPERYSNKAIIKLKEFGHTIFAFGIKSGDVQGIKVQTEIPELDFDTVTIYLNPNNQKQYYDQMLTFNAKRYIFNPGAENEELSNLIKKKGVKSINACTLVMLLIGNF
jgi:predicted CoA-binding protein